MPTGALNVTSVENSQIYGNKTKITEVPLENP
jgi:hypothetical protein